MKVIGHTSTHGVLLEATPEELTRIMGYHYTHELPDWSRHDDPQRSRPAYYFKPGTTIDVTMLWNILGHERARPEKIATAARNLRALAAMLEGVNAALPTPPTEPPPEG